MTHPTDSILSISVSRISLNKTNPRFESVATERLAIEKLCSSENIYQLAADIVNQSSLNPMEIAGLTANTTGKITARTNYTVIEGNRRICALKLLHDPELAPTKLKAKFTKLAETWEPINEVAAVIFQDDADAKPWLERMHEGALAGIGRKDWTSDQKQRFTGDSKNKLAMDLLDYCEEQGFITKLQRKGKLTTVQRFATKDVFQEHFGLDTTDPTQLRRTLPNEDFNTLIKVFLSDLLGGKNVTSRMNKPEVNAYARQVAKTAAITSEHIEAESLIPPATPKPRTRDRKKQTPIPAQSTYLKNSKDITTALGKLGIHKLQSLYYSLTNLKLADHTPLLAVGVWSFLESLTAAMGRNPSNDFLAYLSHNKLTELGFTDKTDRKALRDTIDRIQSCGNTTKHHATGATYASQQLHNDLDMLEPTILKCIQAAPNK